ncbi:MAG: hypothetical protein ACFB10_12570 [Salibacteraceae bacterium]
MRPLNKDLSYENVVILVKALKVSINGVEDNAPEQVLHLLQHFQRLNQGPKAVLPFIEWGKNTAGKLLRLSDRQLNTQF